MDASMIFLILSCVLALVILQGANVLTCARGQRRYFSLPTISKGCDIGFIVACVLGAIAFGVYAYRSGSSDPYNYTYNYTYN